VERRERLGRKHGTEDDQLASVMKGGQSLMWDSRDTTGALAEMGI
jgi:hypothetical protein